MDVWESTLLELKDTLSTREPVVRVVATPGTSGFFLLWVLFFSCVASFLFLFSSSLLLFFFSALLLFLIFSYSLRSPDSVFPCLTNQYPQPKTDPPSFLLPPVRWATIGKHIAGVLGAVNDTILHAIPPVRPRFHFPTFLGLLS
jgi:hypothetical protein